MPSWQRDQRTTTERGYGWFWQKTRDRIARRDNYLCQPCLRRGRPTPFAEVDHIKPKAQGGTDDDDNLECTCIDCHKAKTTAEAAKAQGREVKQRPVFDQSGRVVWGE